MFHQEKLAFISTSATAAFVTDSGYAEVNRIVGRHDAQGAVGAQFAKAQGGSRVFTIYQGGSIQSLTPSTSGMKPVVLVLKWLAT